MVIYFLMLCISLYISICDADTVLTISDILEVYEKVRNASPNWFNLGLALELSYTDLTNFRGTYHGDNDVCLRETLARRLQSGGPLTWGGMCTALRHSTVQRNDVAVEIEGKSKCKALNFGFEICLTLHAHMLEVGREEKLR